VSIALFLYGTLCHDPLLRIVLGREAEAEPALLADHKVTWVADEPFPLIRHEPGAEARGRVLTDLSDEDLARLDFYEGGFGYGTVPSV
jgi:AIG2-like family.